MSPRRPAREENLRRALAQEAARVMAEHGVRDFLFAKRKAAERLGISDEAVMPRNAEVEAALAEYQRLFGAEEHAQSLYAQRTVALDVMRWLKDFSPRLVGGVLSGTATEHADVQLHAFADRAESITFRLMDESVPFEVGERRVKMNADLVLQRPAIQFEVDGQPVEVVVFPVDGIRQAPVSPVDGRPMRRADVADVERLLEQPDVGG